MTALVSTPWWSATFDGARHELTLATAGTPAMAGLAERELRLTGGFVADIARRELGEAVVIEALTIRAAGA